MKSETTASADTVPVVIFPPLIVVVVVVLLMLFTIASLLKLVDGSAASAIAFAAAAETFAVFASVAACCALANAVDAEVDAVPAFVSTAVNCAEVAYPETLVPAPKTAPTAYNVPSLWTLNLALVSGVLFPAQIT